MTVDGKDFGEEIGGVDEAGKEDKTEENLAGPLGWSMWCREGRGGLQGDGRRGGV